jgi:hypothetical protein
MLGIDEYSRQALDMLTNGKARQAFDLRDEKPENAGPIPGWR